MTPQETATFADWSSEVRTQMGSMSSQISRAVGYIIDSAIPYRLGWTPTRAARALLGIDYKDMKYLCGLMTSGTEEPKTL